MNTTEPTRKPLADHGIAPDQRATMVTSPLRLLAHQLRYEVRSARRNPVLLGFTIAMPLAMLAIFGTLLADDTVGPMASSYRQFFTPNVVVLALVSTCFAAMGVSLAVRRQTGELKRLRGTPLPPWVALSAVALQTAALAVIAALAVALCARWWWGVDLPSSRAFAALLVVAAPSLAALGIAAATFIRRPENAPAATNMVLWPLAFISGTFMWVPPGSPLDRLAAVFPVRHLNSAAFAAFSSDDLHIAWSSLGVVLLWGVIGGAVAAAKFRWEPRA